jgi:hypothetical protein
MGDLSGSQVLYIGHRAPRKLSLASQTESMRSSSLAELMSCDISASPQSQLGFYADTMYEETHPRSGRMTLSLCI